MALVKKYPDHDVDCYKGLTVPIIESAVLCGDLAKVVQNVVDDRILNRPTRLVFMECRNEYCDDNCEMSVMITEGIIYKFRRPLQSLIAFVCSLPFVNLDIVKVLLSMGAVPDHVIRPGNKRTALREATTCGRVDVIDVLLEFGADIEYSPKNRSTPRSSAFKSSIIPVQAIALSLAENFACTRRPRWRSSKCCTTFPLTGASFPSIGTTPKIKTCQRI